MHLTNVNQCDIVNLHALINISFIGSYLFLMTNVNYTFQNRIRHKQQLTNFQTFRKESHYYTENKTLTVCGQ